MSSSMRCRIGVIVKISFAKRRICCQTGSSEVFLDNGGVNRDGKEENAVENTNNQKANFDRKRGGKTTPALFVAPVLP